MAILPTDQHNAPKLTSVLNPLTCDHSLAYSIPESDNGIVIYITNESPTVSHRGEVENQGPCSASSLNSHIRVKAREYIMIWFEQIDTAITRWMARYGVILLRISLGIVFLWFGVL